MIRNRSIRLVVLVGAVCLVTPGAAQEVFHSETFAADLSGVVVINDGEASNAWAWDGSCPASGLAGHSSPGTARWGNPTTCLDYGTGGSSDRISAGRYEVPVECTDGVRVNYNYFLEFDEGPCFDRARIEVNLNGSSWVVADNGLCDVDTLVDPRRAGQAPSGFGGNAGLSNLINDATWHAGSALITDAQPGDLIAVDFTGETDDGLFNAGQGFFVDDIVFLCEPAAYEVPTVGPSGLIGLGILLALAAGVLLARRRAHA